MERIIYIADDNSGMQRDDLEDWLHIFYEIHSEYSDWDFDDITGGKDNFLDLIIYQEIKDNFKNKNEKK